MPATPASAGDISAGFPAGGNYDFSQAAPMNNLQYSDLLDSTIPTQLTILAAPDWLGTQNK